MPSATYGSALRRLSSVDAPLPGDLLPADTDREGLREFADQLVWTDASLWEGNPAWRADPAGHLFAPVDASSGPAGRGLLVPHCPLRLRAWLEARDGLDDAAAVTAAVSLLRGCAEADEFGAACGTWWVTASGKPVLALGGTLPWREESDALLARLAEFASPALSGALGAARSVLADPRRLRRDGAAAEDQLFAVTLAEPLDMSPSPERRRSLSAGAPTVAPRRSAPAADGTEPTATRAVNAGTEPAGAAALRAVVRRHLDAEWADRLADGWSRLVARRSASPAPPQRHRRRAIAVGVVAAIVVLALGLSPGTSQRSTASHSGRASASASPTVPAASEPPVSTTRPISSAPEDVQALGEDAVRRLADCAAAGCPSTVVVTPGRDYSVGAATAPSIEREVTLLDEYGGAASFRVRSDDPAGYAEQIVVIVRDTDEWLVRDVYDVADQP